MITYYLNLHINPNTSLPHKEHLLDQIKRKVSTASQRPAGVFLPSIKSEKVKEGSGGGGMVCRGGSLPQCLPLSLSLFLVKVKVKVVLRFSNIWTTRECPEPYLLAFIG